MAPSLFLIFNHRLTPEQERDAQDRLEVRSIFPTPMQLRALWSGLPPESESLSELLDPFLRWLADVAAPGDFVLIQGDFGACYLMVRYALARGLIPVYSTTERLVTEEVQPDGTIKMTRRFRHRMFRRYGA